MAGPVFTYYIADRTTPVKKNDDLWFAPLPSDMRGASPEGAPTAGGYFEVATVFLKADDYSVVLSAVEKQTGNRISVPDIQSIDVFIVKHGQFYHPAKIDIRASGNPVYCALNLAVSEEGVACMEREYPALAALNNIVDAVPEIYGKKDVVSDGRQYSMFLANWFEGFNEFHVSYDNGVKKVVVWDYDNGFYYLSDRELFGLYRQAALIMTKCYNPATYQQIQPWHHAAGDFVVKKDESGVDVKLITVRQYTPMFEDCPDDKESVLQGMLIFFIGLSIRMRLDRVDGVSDAVWADDIVLKAVVEGFFEGLDSLKTVAIFEEGISAAFRTYIKNIDPETILEFTTMVAGSYNPASSDYELVIDNIQAHLVLLSGEIKNAVG